MGGDVRRPAFPLTLFKTKELMMASEDYDAPPAQKTGMDKWFTDQFVLAIIVSICCGFIGLIVNVIGFFVVKDPKAKSNATICMVISLVLVGIGVVLNLMGAFANLGNK